MNDEIWLPVVGYEGLYEVSNRGSVESLPECRRRYGAGGVTMDALAAEFGVSGHTMRTAIRGETWQYVDPLPI